MRHGQESGRTDRHENNINPRTSTIINDCKSLRPHCNELTWRHNLTAMHVHPFVLSIVIFVSWVHADVLSNTDIACKISIHVQDSTINFKTWEGRQCFTRLHNETPWRHQRQLRQSSNLSRITRYNEISARVNMQIIFCLQPWDMTSNPYDVKLQRCDIKGTQLSKLLSPNIQKFCLPNFTMELGERWRGEGTESRQNLS